MGDILTRKSILRKQKLFSPFLLLEKTKCVGLEELEVAESQEERHGDLNGIVAKLIEDFGKDRSIAVDVAFASVCCSCP